MAARPVEVEQENINPNLREAAKMVDASLPGFKNSELVAWLNDRFILEQERRTRPLRQSVGLLDVSLDRFGIGIPIEISGSDRRPDWVRRELEYSVDMDRVLGNNLLPPPMLDLSNWLWSINRQDVPEKLHVMITDRPWGPETTQELVLGFDGKGSFKHGQINLRIGPDQSSFYTPITDRLYLLSDPEKLIVRQHHKALEVYLDSLNNDQAVANQFALLFVKTLVNGKMVQRGIREPFKYTSVGSVPPIPPLATAASR